MTPTSLLAGLLTGLLDGTIVVAVVLLVVLLTNRRRAAHLPVHPVADDRPGPDHTVDPDGNLHRGV